MSFNIKQRSARKVFQDYFTGLLFSNQQHYEKLVQSTIQNPTLQERDILNHLNFTSYVNKHLNNACYLIWYSLLLNYPNNDKSLVWNQIFRFYLKGTKTFISILEKYKKEIQQYNHLSEPQNYTELEDKNDKDQYYYLEDNNQTQELPSSEDFTKVIAQELIKNSKDSDFDFTFCCNPSDIATYHTFHVEMIQKSLDITQRYLQEHLLNDLHLKTFIDLCNLPSNQKKLFESITTYKSYFDSHDRKTMRYIADKISKGQYFHFDIDDIKLINCDIEDPKRTVTDLDEFYLFRVVLKMKCTENLNITFPFFSELIDISFSIKPDIAKKLWENSTLNNMIHPINLIDEINNYGYPIANLNYLIDDNILILQEQDPNKPAKRCKNLLNFIKLNCIEQNLPELPNEIVIFHKVYDQLMKEDCSTFLFKELFILKNQTSEWITFSVNPKFQSLIEFEKWCVQQNLSFENNILCRSMLKHELVLNCYNYISHFVDKLIIYYQFIKKSQTPTDNQKLFISKQKNYLVSPSIRNIQLEKAKTFLLHASKKLLCVWYTELKFIDQLMEYWTNFEHIQTQYFIERQIIDPNTSSVEINDQLVKVIQKILGYFMIYERKLTWFSIQKLIEPIKSTNSFADFICKFNVIQTLNSQEEE